ncbi:MAG: DMT family transporter [Gammaproteobacteria bacterium]|nr:DMT family transporter [Gammaproteobacteria bacterium]
MQGQSNNSAQQQGLFYGLIGVIGFSLTPPTTSLAVAGLDPTFVGLGRAVLAALPAAILLLLFRAPLPARRHMPGLVIVALCAVILFPLLSAWSLFYLSAANTGVILGILPLATAVAGVLRAGEHPSRLFWLTSALGSGTVMVFSLLNGGGALQPGDLILLLAIVIAALGYAEGARLVPDLGGWQVICWALVLALPVLLVPFLLVALPMSYNAPGSAWFGFLYLTLSSQLLSYFPWYRGLSLGGIARVSQLMLLMPFITILASQLMLDAEVSARTWLFAVLVVIIVAINKQFAFSQSNATKGA